MIKKFIIAVLLALSSVVSFAKPFAYTEFSDARVVLKDTQGACPKDQFEAYVLMKNSTKPINACWDIHPENPLFIKFKDETGYELAIPLLAFEEVHLIFA